MSSTIRVPTSLRKLTGGHDVLEVGGENISAVIDELNAKFPGFKDRLCEPDGNLKRFVNFFVNDEDIRFLEDVKTLVKDGDEISIVPAIAGGR